jgi:tetratricopeptide (TPR) repeat protein
MPLEPEHTRRLLAAEGYLELGMPLDAMEELELIATDGWHVPEVLMLQMEVCRQLEKWDRMQALASRLAKNDPDEVQWAVSWAFATRRADSIESAQRILLHALERHPSEPILHFNLGCYACQLGDLEGAKKRLAVAFELDSSWRMLALKDEDLRPLWDFLAG